MPPFPTGFGQTVRANARASANACAGTRADAAAARDLSMAEPEEFSARWLRARLSALLPLDEPSSATGTGSAFVSAGGVDAPRAAAVLVPIVPAPTPMVLLTRRSALLRTHSGQVSFPGGRPDPEDRNLAATALREAQEEIGLDPGHVTLLGRLPRQDTRASNFLITPFVGLLSADARWAAAPGEVDAIFGLELGVLLDPDAPRRIEDGLRSGTWSWPHPDHDIWGATAAILVRLARLLRGA